LTAALAALVRWEAGPSAWIVPEPASAVRSLEVAQGGRRVAFTRGASGWTPATTSSVVAEAAGPGYRGVASPTLSELDARLDWVLDRLCRQEAAISLPAGQIAGSEFGLEPPWLEVTLQAGTTHRLEVGALNPAGDGRYFRLPGLSRAGLLRRDVAGELESLAGGGPRH
jgi:hypothetical protein